MSLFKDRTEAGRTLAELVRPSVNAADSVVLALPRGGVPVGFEIARALPAPLDVFVVRKLGMPGQEELAIGALATGGVRVLNHDLIRHLGVSNALIERITAFEAAELARRESLYREDRKPVPVGDRTAILTDDGLATGATMMAAIKALRPQGPRRIVVAVPVAARQTCDEFRKEVDLVICAETPHPFNSVGLWYDDFSQTSDEEVRKLLEAAAADAPLGRMLEH